jgi:molybdate transport system regulatory protein
MSDPTDTPRLRLRIIFSEGVWMGPGKAELLDRIARTGSIAAAGREMGMSYKRAWQLVEAMNTMFREPLVTSARGGAKGGGATVTEAGQTVLAAYQGMVDAASRAGADEMAVLRAMRPETPGGK